MSVITLSITETRQRLLNLVKEAQEMFERVVITKNGKPEAVLISFDEYESWLETLEITQDKNLMKGIQEAKKDIKAGRLHSFEKVFGKNKPAQTKRK